MLRALPVLLFAGVAVGADPDAKEPDYPAMKQKWVDDRSKRAEELKLQAEDAAKEAKKDLEKKKALLKNAYTKADVAKAKREIEKAKTKADEADSAVNTAAADAYKYGPSFRDIKPGMFGRFSTNGSLSEPPILKVLQVVDAKNAILTWGPTVYWVETDTAGMVDDQQIPLKMYVHCLGTKRFEPVRGGAKTVLHLRFVD